MKGENVLKAIRSVRKISKKRNFNQSFDLIINLKGFDVKKDKIFEYVKLRHKVKEIKICAFVDEKIENKAKEICDKVIVKNEFSKFDKKSLKNLKEFDFFIAQENLMADVARVFGKVLGPLGLMPDPKAGCIIGLGSDLKSIVKRLKSVIRIQNKNEASVKCVVGKESMKDEEVCDNVLEVYNALVHKLPEEKHNIKSVILKLSMGKPVVIKNAS